MAASCFSLAAFRDSRLRKVFSAAGLELMAIQIDEETRLECWMIPERRRKPALLLLHGFGCPSTWQWYPQIPSLSPHFDLYVPSFLFFGESTTTSPERSEVFQAECVAKLMIKKLGIDRFNVVGTSYGGFVAYHMARLYPEAVERVVIASSAVNRKARDNDELLRKAGVNDISELLLPRTPERMRQILSFIFCRPPPLLPNFLLNDLVNTLFTEGRSEKLQLLSGVTLGHESQPFNVTPLRQDVLIIWGKLDKLFPLHKAYELQKMIGENVRLQVIDKASHAPQLEKPHLFNEIVKKFILENVMESHKPSTVMQRRGERNRS